MFRLHTACSCLTLLCLRLLHLLPEILELMQWGHHLSGSIINILFFFGKYSKHGHWGIKSLKSMVLDYKWSIQHCVSGDYPNRMSGWLEVSFGADQGGKDRFCQLRQRVVDAHVFAYRGICARCTMASRINTRWQPPVTNFPPALFKMLRYSVRHRGEQHDLVIQRLLKTLKIALFYSVAAWQCLYCIWGEGSRYVSYLVQHVQWVKNA